MILMAFALLVRDTFGPSVGHTLPIPFFILQLQKVNFQSSGWRPSQLTSGGLQQLATFGCLVSEC